MHFALKSHLVISDSKKNYVIFNANALLVSAVGTSYRIIRMQINDRMNKLEQRAWYINDVN